MPTPRSLRNAASLSAMTVLVLAGGCAAPADVTVSGATQSDVSAWLARGDCRDAAAPARAASSATVLTVTPDHGATASRYSLADLDALPQVECTVDDRQAEGRRVTFTGPLVSTVLQDAGVADTSTLHTSALNDYEVDVPVSDTEQYPVLLATRLEGEPMSVAHYGPTRFVYPTTGFDLDPVVYDPRWVWQLRSITAR